MRAGRVVQIRVNPKDCLTCVDIVKEIQMFIPGMSFAQVVSVAFSSALNTLRGAGAVPDHDGFEYEQVMSQFPSSIPKRGRMLDITRTFQVLGAGTQVPMSPEVAHARRKNKLRYQELQMKVDAGEIENMTPEEIAEWSSLQSAFHDEEGNLLD